MPIYEYQCTKCEFVQDALHKMNEQPEINCNKCKALCKKIISAVAGKVKDPNGKPYWHPDMKPSEFVDGKE